MKTILILVGKTQNKHFIVGIKDYTERIGHYMPFEIRTLPELKNTKSLTEAQQKVTMFANANEELRPLDIRSRGLRAPCREAPPRCFSWFL